MREMYLGQLERSAAFREECGLVLEILTATRALLSRPERWTQRAYARDGAGQPVCNHEPEACCWCLSGAVARTSRAYSAKYLSLAYQAIYAAAGVEMGGLIDWNDAPGRTHADVIAMLDAAIMAEEARAT
jgi:hypothetical protein